MSTMTLFSTGYSVKLSPYTAWILYSVGFPPDGVITPEILNAISTAQPSFEEVGPVLYGSDGTNLVCSVTNVASADDRGNYIGVSYNPETNVFQFHDDWVDSANGFFQNPSKSLDFTKFYPWVVTQAFDPTPLPALEWILPLGSSLPEIAILHAISFAYEAEGAPWEHDLYATLPTDQGFRGKFYHRSDSGDVVYVYSIDVTSDYVHYSDLMMTRADLDDLNGAFGPATPAPPPPLQRCDATVGQGDIVLGC